MVPSRGCEQRPETLAADSRKALELFHGDPVSRSRSGASRVRHKGDPFHHGGCPFSLHRRLSPFSFPGSRRKRGFARHHCHGCHRHRVSIPRARTELATCRVGLEHLLSRPCLPSDPTARWLEPREHLFRLVHRSCHNAPGPSNRVLRRACLPRRLRGGLLHPWRRLHGGISEPDGQGGRAADRDRPAHALFDAPARGSPRA